MRDETYTEGGALDLEHWYDEEEKSRDNRGLDTKRLQRAILRRPRDLEVRDGEASKRTRQVYKPRDLALMPREAIITICV